METVDQWLVALETRYTRAFGRHELLKAIRALSARYVEQRATLPRRSPLDSAGKRAAFAAFYAPLHFLTTREVLRALEANRRRLDAIVDFGCGTGVAGAAWALAGPESTPFVRGVDHQSWAVAEAAWNWRALGLRGHARRSDMVSAAAQLVDRSTRHFLERTGSLFGWSVNELGTHGQRKLLPIVLELARRGSAVLIIEPVARRLTPWFDKWGDALTTAGGRQDDWRFDSELPPHLADLDAAAGFEREGLTARTLGINV